MIKSGIGQPVSRKEDPRFLTGRGRFVDDIHLPGEAHAVVLRSPHAHALIRKVDTTQAQVAPGVLLVLTGADAEADQIGGLPPMFMPEDMGGDPGGKRTVQPILCADRVRHVGDRVALVVAETLAQAKDAAELIDVDYDPLPAVPDIAGARTDGAPLLWDHAPGNLCFTMSIGDAAATDAAFARAAHVERLDIVHNRLAPCPMEPRAALATHDAVLGRTTLWATSQAPHRLKQFIAGEVFRVPANEFAVDAPDVGGGFGAKGQLYPEDSLVCWASRRLGRPVRWTGERMESIATDAAGRDQLHHAEMAFAADGRILGLRAAVDANVGAYLSTAGSATPVSVLRLLSSVYAIPAVHGTLRGFFSNTNPVGNYRGAGRPEAAYTVERLIESGARALEIDPVELRRRNLIAPAAMPYRTHCDLTYDVGEFAMVMDKTLALADAGGFAARRAESERRGKLRGFGVAPFLEFAAQFNERMGLRIEADGSATILAGTHSHGQGHETIYAQLVAEWLGVDYDRVRLIQGDTERVPYGRGTFASRSATVGGAALREAADKIIEKGRKVAAAMLEAAESDIEFADGAFRIAGTDRRLPLATVAHAAASRAAGPLAKLGIIGLEAEAAHFPAFNFPNGCHVCEVEVDPETGAVALVCFAAVDDVGVAINPLLVDGQVHGGIAQGIGQALMEGVVYDPDSGQLLTGSLLDYSLPRADDFPAIKVGLHEVPTTTNPLGVKGAGEAGCIGAPAAAIAAILDALAPLGVSDIAMPATPERIWRAIRSANLRSETVE
jgi:carbon-monoxide dehydrogenase large subunit